MPYNLTDSQKAVIEFLVEQSRNGSLGEEIMVTWTMGGSSVINYRGDHPDLKQGTLTVLESNQLINIVDRGRHTWRFVLTGTAFEAVDSNFQQPDNSFLKYLTPLDDISDFDEEIKQRCLPLLAAGGTDPVLWDSAVRTAAVILEERLKDVSGITGPKSDGRNLVNAIFGKEGTLAHKFTNESELQGYRELYAGVFGVIRNPYAHRLIDPSPEEGGAFIVFLNLLLKKLEALR
jgi:hypothetical protein